MKCKKCNGNVRFVDIIGEINIQEPKCENCGIIDITDIQNNNKEE
jgi:hypothetical protein